MSFWDRVIEGAMFTFVFVFAIFVLLLKLALIAFVIWAIIGVLNYFGITDVNLPGLA